MDASGSKIHRVAVGFYPEFPVQTIRSTWLSAIPDRFANVLFSIFIGIIGAAIGLALKDTN